jgi:hypothetical protein
MGFGKLDIKWYLVIGYLCQEFGYLAWGLFIPLVYSLVRGIRPPEDIMA